MSESENQLEEFVDDSPAEDIEKAKQIGWKAPSDWVGPAPRYGKFLKAKEYLEKAETFIPMMTTANKKLKDELSDARSELKTFKEGTAKTIENMSRMTKVALDRQRDQLEEKYSAAIDAATEVGDKEQVRKLRDAERKDLKAFDEAADEAKPSKEEVAKGKENVNDALPKDVQDTIGGWIANNTWYSSDAEMQGVANAYHGKLLKEKQGLTLAENLEQVRAYVAKRYPEQFGEQDEPDDDDKPARGSRVEGGSRLAGASSRSKYSQLPADAKAQADKFIKDDGLFLEKGETADKDLAKARERYAASYLEM
jgi:YesN/AraC family two-component response regulator